MEANPRHVRHGLIWQHVAPRRGTATGDDPRQATAVRHVLPYLATAVRVPPPAVLQGEGDYLTESQPSFRAKVIPTLIKPGKAIGLYYYPLDDGRKIYSPAEIGKGLPMLPFDKFYQKVKGKAPSGKLWDVFREVNRAGSMAQRSIILPPGSPKAAIDALRAAVHKLNKDPGFKADAKKTVNFVPMFDVGPAAEKIMKASIKLTKPTLDFLRGYIAKVDKK